MYRCLECGHLFEEGEGKKVEETLGECHGTSATETYYVCPCCGSNDFEKAKECLTCGEWFVGNGDFCEECKIYYKRGFKKLLDKTYDENERKLINELFEGEEL